MKEDIFRIKSISQLCDVMGFEKPTHPLITIVDNSKWNIPDSAIGVKYTSDLYFISLKDKGCGMQYGRHSYDFDEGVLMFAAPGQVASATKAQKLNEIQGWSLFFHKDMIRNTHMENEMDHYSFFSYDVYEALHLSEKEQQIVSDCIEKMSLEVSERIDNHSNRVIVSGIELLLNYSMRFYERQFNTRSVQNKGVVTTVERIMKQYYSEGLFASSGQPSSGYISEKVHLSQHYLSDLLKKETGKTTKEYINEFIVDKAKTLLLSSTESISEIAYTLGFTYPHYFGRLFKNKTGMTPKEYRGAN